MPKPDQGVLPGFSNEFNIRVGRYSFSNQMYMSVESPLLSHPDYAAPTDRLRTLKECDPWPLARLSREFGNLIQLGLCNCVDALSQILKQLRHNVTGDCNECVVVSNSLRLRLISLRLRS